MTSPQKIGEVSSSGGSINPKNIDSTPLKWRSLSEIYEKSKQCIIEPENYSDAIGDKSWRKSRCNEMSMINKNNTWELVDRLYDKPVIGVKWVYKTKLNLYGIV